MEFDTEHLLAALALIWQVQSAPNLDEYRSRVLGVGRLVRGHIVGYNEVDRASGRTFAVLEPPEALFDGVHELFARYAHQQPVLRHFSETGDPRARAISDFLSEEELHSLELYRKVYEPLGVEDQIGFLLPSPSETVVGVVINRSTRGFTEGERSLLELVRPHLSQAFRDAGERSRKDPLSDARLRERGLTPRQAEVVRALADGASAPQIAERLGISPNTARKHIANVYEVLGVNSRGAAVAALLRGDGLSRPPDQRGDSRPS
jgi:DNA-binding CsgD family transcriptional regulator